MLFRSSPSVGIIFNFFHQCLIIFCIQVFFVSLGRFIPRYFILLVAMVNGSVFLISLSDFSSLEMWMQLETVIQSEVSQKEKNKYHILTHICGT